LKFDYRLNYDLGFELLFKFKYFILFISIFSKTKTQKNKMNNLIYFFLLATALKYSQPECIDEIKKLAKRDKCLSSRADLKRLYAKTETKEMFVTKIITSKCKGTEFACGLTRSWVSEVFVGLANQYLDSKNDQIEDGTAIGYNYLVGDELKSLFNTNKNSAYTIIYQVRMVGDEDHVNNYC
jgi:hypothetical protein